MHTCWLRRVTLRTAPAEFGRYLRLSSRTISTGLSESVDRRVPSSHAIPEVDALEDIRSVTAKCRVGQASRSIAACSRPNLRAMALRVPNFMFFGRAPLPPWGANYLFEREGLS